MATRDIRTSIYLDGEKEFKSALSSINSEIKVLDSELKLVESQFKGNANSMEALQAKAKALSNVQEEQNQKLKTLSDAYKNAQTAIKNYEESNITLANKIKAHEAALESLKQAEGDTTAEQERLTAEIKEASDQIKGNEEAIGQWEKRSNNWQASINKTKVELNDTNSAIADNDRYMEEAAGSADKCATSINRFGKEVKGAGEDAKKAGNDAKEFGDKSREGIDGLVAALAAAGLATAFNKIAEGIKACLQVSMEFESAMAGVAKTTNIAGPELERMSEEIRKMATEIPLAASEIASITENAGQLGIQKESLMGFTRVMADLGVATNLTGEQAAQSFAKFANITQMPQENFDRLGSTVVALGNNLATTEADISDMAMRLAAAGKQAGMTEADIVSIAGALSSVGMEAEAGGTAFSKAINTITIAVETGNGNLAEFARIAGMSAEEFAAAWKDDAAGALIAFTEGLGNAEMHGASATVLLDELGFTQERLGDAMKRAAGSGDLFSDALKLGNQAWEENSALANEAAQRYGTTESKLEMLKNSAQNLMGTIGDQLNPAMQNFIDIGRGMVEWAQDLFDKNEMLAPTLAAITIGVGVAAGAFAAYSVAVTIGTKITEAFKKVLETPKGPITLLISLIAGLVAAISAYAIATYEADKESQRLLDSSKKLADEMKDSAEAFGQNGTDMEVQANQADKLAGRLDELSQKTSLTASEQAELKGIVGILNETYPELGLSIDEATGKLEQNSEQVKLNVEALKEQAAAHADEARYIEMLDERSRAESELEGIQARRAELLKGLDDEQKEQILTWVDMGDAMWDVGDKAKYFLGLVDGDAGTLYGALRDLKAAEEELNEGLEDSSYEFERLEGKLDGATEATGENTAATQENKDAIAEQAALLADVEPRTANMAALLDSLKISTETYTDAIQNMTLAERETFDAALVQQAAIESISQTYQEEYIAVHNSLTGQMGLLDNMDSKVEVTTGSILDNLQSQIDFLTNYSTNFDALKNRNIDGIEVLLNTLSDGSAESAAILAALAGETDDKVIEIIEGMKEVGTGQDNLSEKTAEFKIEMDGELEGVEEKAQTAAEKFIVNMGKTQEGADKFVKIAGKMATDFGLKADDIEKRTAEMVKNCDKSEDMKTVGGNLGHGLYNGLNEWMTPIVNKAADIVKSAVAAAKKAGGIASPSKIFKQIGSFMGEGLVIGLDESQTDVKRASAKMAEATSTGYVEEINRMAARNTPQSIYDSSVHYGGSTTISAPLYVTVNGSMTDAQMQKLIKKWDRNTRRIAGL